MPFTLIGFNKVYLQGIQNLHSVFIYQGSLGVVVTQGKLLFGIKEEVDGRGYTEL